MNKRIKFLIPILFLIGVTIGGYSLFLATILKLTRQELVLGIGLVATIAGIASFFNPCSFPLLPAFLAQYYTHEKKERKGETLQHGLLSASGVISFNIILGLLIGLLGLGFGESFGLAGDSPSFVVLIARGAIGFLLIILGYSHATGRGLQFGFLNPLIQRITGSKNLQQARGSRKFYWYGFFYPLIGIGCGGPILAALSAYAISLGGIAQILTAFFIYSLVMGALMVFVSLLVAYSKVQLLDSLKGAIGPIKKTSGILLVVVGIFLVLSSIFVKTFVGILFP